MIESEKRFHDTPHHESHRLHDLQKVCKLVRGKHCRPTRHASQGCNLKKKQQNIPASPVLFLFLRSQEDTMRMPLTLPRREQRQKSQTGRSGCAGPLPHFRFVHGWYICIFRRDRTLSTPAPRFNPQIHTTRQCESPTNRQGACQTHHGAPTTTTTRINK